MARRSASFHLAFACLLAVACGGGNSPAPSGGGTPGGGPARFSIIVAVTGSGKVASAPAGIDCGTACNATFPAGTRLALAATPSAGWHLAAWGGACSGTAGCDLTVAGDLIVAATFAQDQPPPPPPPPPPPANACAGIAPPDDVAMRQHVLTRMTTCLPGAGDAGGTLALAGVFHEATAHGATIDFVSTGGALLAQRSLFAPPALLEQPDGVAAIAGPSPYQGPPNLISLPRWNHGGSPLGEGSRFGDRSRVVAAPNPGGGVLLAGDIAVTYNGPAQHVAELFAGSAAQSTLVWGPTPLASAGAVFGAGVDRFGRSLVITDGAQKFGGGAISAQWFDSDGTALTGEFLLLGNFTPGASTWFEASPLAGGGLLVRRIDSDHGLHSVALVVVAGGAAQASPPPGWMTSRRDVQFHLARNNRAYATLPYGATSAACSQRVEVLAPDGTSCGSRDYSIAAGNCDTGTLTLAMDGTVIQPLPLSMETAVDVHGAHTCTWRWWSGAVR